VQQNYCTALLDDPLLKGLRKDTAFKEVLTAAKRCQEWLKAGPESSLKYPEHGVPILENAKNEHAKLR